MSKENKLTDKNGNVVMEFKDHKLVIYGEVETKEPSVDSVDDFVRFLRNINYRLNQLEKEVTELKKKPVSIDVDKIINKLNDQLDIIKAYGLK
jgi:hypothetical protein